MSTFIKSGLWADKRVGTKGELNLDELIERIAGGGSSYTFSNGLTNNAGVVSLGGNFDQDIIITGVGGASFYINGDVSNLELDIDDTIILNCGDDNGSPYSSVYMDNSGYVEIATSEFFPPNMSGLVSISLNPATSTGTARFNMFSDGFQAIANGAASSTFKGLYYGADYSANFTARSLVDKAYVDSLSGGWTVNGTTNLTGNVSIDTTSTNTLVIGDVNNASLIFDPNNQIVGHNSATLFSGNYNTYNRYAEIGVGSNSGVTSYSVFIDTDWDSSRSTVSLQSSSSGSVLNLTTTLNGSTFASIVFNSDVSGNRIAIQGTTTFTPTATVSGINVGSLAGDPSTLSNGDIWYNSSTGKFRGRAGGVSIDLH